MSDRFILSLKYSFASTPALGKRAVGAFLRYVEFRDQHTDAESNDRSGTDGLLRYVAHRDQASRRGELFGPVGRAGHVERRELATHVARSLVGVKAVNGKPPRSVYRFVLSPERAEGLDLQELARSAMRQLEADCGPLPPWAAAIHRNTAHPHVHIVLAARQELSAGRFKGITITRARLARVKVAVGQELSQERGERSPTRRPRENYGRFVTRASAVRSRHATVRVGRLISSFEALVPLRVVARFLRTQERLRQAEEEVRRLQERERHLERGR